ncbi:MAG TPA: CoA transferase [Pseudomonadales bacterium]|jgi:crotonobetainyl-CoA:carnitine CoA-transferase CaiB-like acyl-CoA transferase|nr:CoA transferase [Pseudomonadales bacterium]HJP51830.1 CoA transferase [Pseudomonadales bacterium]
MPNGPLRGVKILDLSHVWAGPLGTRILADLGAEVVKIEAAYRRGPLQFPGEPMGGWITAYPEDEPWNRNAIFVKLARNSKSVCIDLKNENGRTTFLELVAEADVVIENFSARTMPGFRLGYEDLKAANPSIIYVTMPGFGTYGPYRDRVAFGPSVEPMSGLTNVMGYGESEPRNTAMALVDPIAAVSASAAVVTALREREQTGKGVYVEMSLHESGVSFSGPWLVEHQLGAEIKSIGNQHPQMAPHGVYRCRGEDEWIAIACPGDLEWGSLYNLIGEYLTGSDLAVNTGLEQRQENHELIDKAISAWTADRPKTEAAIALQQAGICAGAVNTTPDMTSDPQVAHRGFFVPLDGGIPMPGNPIKMIGLSSADWTPCPRLGGNNAEVLKDWLDYSDDQIDDLVTAGVLGDRPPA